MRVKSMLKAAANTVCIATVSTSPLSFYAPVKPNRIKAIRKAESKYVLWVAFCVPPKGA